VNALRHGSSTVPRFASSKPSSRSRQIRDFIACRSSFSAAMPLEPVSGASFRAASVKLLTTARSVGASVSRVTTATYEREPPSLATPPSASHSSS
jgi:hypothetical protein